MNEITQEQVDRVHEELICLLIYTPVGKENEVVARWHLTQMAAIQEKLAAAEKERDEWKTNCADAVNSVLEARDMLDPGGNLSAREAAQNLRCDVADMRIKLEESEAAASVMREALSKWIRHRNAIYDCIDGCNCSTCEALRATQQALIPTAGKDLLEKVGRYEAALKKISEYDGEPIWKDDRDDAANDMLIIAQEALAQQTLKEL